MRFRVICEDGATPMEHDFPLMPRIGNLFVFPGQYAIYEVSDILHNRDVSEGSDVIANSVAIVVKKKPAREIVRTG